MSVTGRIIVCLIPSILLWGGCAAPALMKPKTTVDALTAEQADGQPGEEATPRSPMVTAEAALIRQIALEKGYAETDANWYEQSILNAQPEHRKLITQTLYALLNRQQDLTPATNTPAPVVPAPVTPSLDSAHLVSRVGSDASPPDPAPAVKTVSHTKPSPAPADPPVAQRPTAAQNPTAGATPKTGPGNASIASDVSPSEAESSTTATNPANDLSDIKTSSESVATQAPETVAANQQAQLKSEAGTEPARSEESEQAATQLSWQRQLRLAIARLNRDLTEQKDLDPLDETRLRACLGLLQLAAEDPEKAMEALNGLDEQQLEFWRQTIMGLDILMAPDDLPKMRYRVESATEHLQSGLSTLATMGPLQVRNLAFVKEVRGYGTYDEVKSHTFSSGEPVLLYVEFRNFTAEQISAADDDTRGFLGRRGTETEVPMFETVLAGRYDILDQNQRVVMSRTLPVIRDHCRQQRHDFFHAYSFVIPQGIPSGYYTIELSIEDQKGGKFGSGMIDLKIR